MPRTDGDHGRVTWPDRARVGARVAAILFGILAIVVVAAFYNRDRGLPPPAGLSLTTAGSHVTLDWNPARSGTRGGFLVYRDNTEIAAREAPPYEDYDVCPSTSYQYAVRAYDVDERRSPISPEVTVVTPVARTQAIFFVAPSGNDSNPGSETLPFQTVDRARTAVRQINRSMAGDIIVYLRDGEYVLPSTLRFDEGDSASGGFQIIYEAYPGERPVLSGGERIRGWMDAGNGLFKAPAEGPPFRQFYVNGNRGTRARTPNSGSYFRLQSWDTERMRIEIASGDLARWQDPGNVEMVIQKHWDENRLRVSSSVESDRSVYIVPAEPERSRSFLQKAPERAAGQAFHFENALEFLDAPGEWFVDRNRQLWYRPSPGEDLSTAAAVAPRLETLLQIEGSPDAPVHDISFREITFAHTTWLAPDEEGYVGDQAGITFTEPHQPDQTLYYTGRRIPGGIQVAWATRISLVRNVIRNFGGSGVVLSQGTRSVAVRGNRLRDISGNGIAVDVTLVGNPADIRSLSRDDVVENNHISGTGRDYYGTVGIFGGYVDGLRIEHNELSDMPYSGISVGWGWSLKPTALRANVIRYNRVFNVFTLLDDGGGIYTLSSQPGTLIAQNHIFDLTRAATAGQFPIAGIYLDNASDLMVIRDNAVARVPAIVYLQTYPPPAGSGNVVLDNRASLSEVMAHAGVEPLYTDAVKGTNRAQPSCGVRSPAD